MLHNDQMHITALIYKKNLSKKSNTKNHQKSSSLTLSKEFFCFFFCKFHGIIFVHKNFQVHYRVKNQLEYRHETEWQK